MKGRLITVVPIVVLLAAGLFLTPSSDVLAEDITCFDCADCSQKLRSGLYDTVTLDRNINNHVGSCIGLLLGESNVVFDCGGYTIDGDGMAIDPEAGIAMMHGSGNTIQNCTVTDFNEGIYLHNATSHVVTNNTLTSNDTGIRLSWSDSNDINNNTITGNYNGIEISNSEYNAIDANTVCQSDNLDFYLASGTGNSGDNNTCDSPGSWNDDGTTGCTNGCTGTATCNSCSDCSSKLDGTSDKVMLTQDISNHVGTCITFGASNIEFDCDSHQIDGDDSGTDYGIEMNAKSGNTVKNCDVRDFQHGIFLTGASGNTVSRSTAHSNTSDGIHLDNATGNTIAIWNEANSNDRYGIYLWASSNNDVFFNEANSNGSAGMYLGHSASNMITFNDVLNNNDPDGWGIYMYSSDSNTVSNNQVVGNHYGIKFDNSDSNTLNSNTVCSDPSIDFEQVGGSSGNSGDHNTCCASPSHWNDTGETGCTNPCDTAPDANDNGISDACDCADARQGLNETGIDCGGLCPACLAVPAGWNNVTGVRLRGAPNSGLIDVVFVPEQSYSGGIAPFNTAVTDNIAEWILRLEELTDESLPADYRDRFNFYTYTGGFGTLDGCAGNLPTNFWSDAPGTDAAVLLSPDSAGGWGCTLGHGPPGHNIRLEAVAEREGQVMHELGHGVFGLTDYYCGNNTTYRQDSPITNVWTSLSNCQTDATAQGWTDGVCTQIASATCSQPYWKYDTTSLMDGSWFLCTDRPGNVCTHDTDAFKEAAMWRINWAFDTWVTSSSKGILTHFNINQGVITELSSELVNGHPDVGLQAEDFRVQLRSGDDKVLQQYGMGDPRIELRDDRGPTYVDNVDFSVTFPYQAGVEKAEIRDPETEELLVTVDLSALECTCNSCSDCEQKLRDPACLVVKLTQDIIDHQGTCIGLIMGENDADFDCDGHTIDGDDIAIDPEHGITMMHGTGNSVRNCVISDFSNGIYLYDAANHVLKGNTLTSNDEGIELGLSDANYLISNTVSANYNGIVMNDSDTNTVRSNVVCQNTNLDFYLASGTGNYGAENWCDNPDGWNDNGKTGCSIPCTGTSLHISPTVSTVGISDTVMVDVMVNNVADLYGVQLNLSFDPSIVQVEDAIPGGDVNIIPGDFLQPETVVFRNTVNNSTGEIEYVETLSGTVPGVDGTGVLARIVFHGRAAGTSPLAFTNHVLGDPQSVPIAHGYEDGEITVRVQTGSVQGKVILERRVNVPNANAGVGVRLAGQLQVTGDDGTFSFSQVPEGTHQISSTNPSYVPTWRNVEVTAGATTTLPDVTMLGGDCGSSVPQGEIYHEDGTEIGLAWGGTPGDAQWNPRCDIRDDQVIDVLDLTAVRFNWRKTAPGPWPGAAAAPQEAGWQLHESSLAPQTTGAAQSARWQLHEPFLAPQSTAQTTIVVSPTLVRTHEGFPVTAEIWVQDVEAFYGGAFLLDFDPSVVQVQDVDPYQSGVQIESGSWLKQQLALANRVNNTAGEVDFAVTQSYPETGKDGSGVLARITFVGLAEGISALEFSRWQLANDEGGIIPASPQNGEVVVYPSYPIYLPLVLRDSG